MAEEWPHSSSEAYYIGDYRVIGRLGSGAFGEVLRGEHRESGRAVALKHIFFQAPQRGEDAGAVRLRQGRELAALRAVAHPNVVQLLDVLPQGEGQVLVMELCATDLAEVLAAAHMRLDEAAVKALAAQLLRGVRACHSAGYLHRDLKPSNLLLTDAGALKVADLGLARLHDAASCSGAGIEGEVRAAAYTHAVATRWYRAPELLLGTRRYGPAADMWAVGCILAEMLGLGPLFPGETDLDQLGRVTALLGSIDEARWPAARQLPDYGKVLFAECAAVPLAEVLPDASPAVLDLLQHLLQWNPDDRLDAPAALQHSFFAAEPLPAQPHELAELVTHAREAAASQKCGQR